jgi:hypothetical protein
MPKRKSVTGDLFAPEEEPYGHDLTDPTDPSDSSTSSTIADLPGPQNHTHNTQRTHPAAKRRQEETKSKRLNLLVRPGVLKEFAKIAHMQHTSVNDLLNRLMAEHNEKEAAAIRQYDRLFKEKGSK